MHHGWSCIGECFISTGPGDKQKKRLPDNNNYFQFHVNYKCIYCMMRGMNKRTPLYIVSGSIHLFYFKNPISSIAFIGPFALGPSHVHTAPFIVLYQFQTFNLKDLPSSVFRHGRLFLQPSESSNLSLTPR